MHNSTDSVRIVLFDSANPNKFLILSESDDPDNFKLPGGKFENTSESSDEASIRELKEELGLEPNQVNLKLAGELINDDGFSKRFIYSGSVLNSNIKPSNEIAKILWVDENNIPESKNKSHISSAVSLCKSLNL